MAWKKHRLFVEVTTDSDLSTKEVCGDLTYVIKEFCKINGWYHSTSIKVKNWNRVKAYLKTIGEEYWPGEIYGK